MKCQRQITKMRLQDHIRNCEVAASRSGVGSHHTPPELRLRSHWRASWRHASPTSTPVSCRSDSRPSPRPKLEASPRSSQQLMDWPATQWQQQHATSWLWRRSTTLGHSGVTLRSSTTTRWRRRRRRHFDLRVNILPETTVDWIHEWTAFVNTWIAVLWELEKTISVLYWTGLSISRENSNSALITRPSSVSNYQYYKQDSIAIAKKTARCAQYMGALKSFESPHYAPENFSRNL